MWVLTVLIEMNSEVPISRAERSVARRRNTLSSAPVGGSEPAGSCTSLGCGEVGSDGPGERGQPPGVGEALDLGSGLGEIGGRLAEKASADPDSGEREQRVRMREIQLIEERGCLDRLPLGLVEFVLAVQG